MIAPLFGRGRCAVGVDRVACDRDVQIERIGLDRKLKPGGHDADDGVLLAIKLHGLAKDISVAAELGLPEIMTKNDLEPTRSAAGLLIHTSEAAADHWIDPQHLEKFCAYL